MKKLVLFIFLTCTISATASITSSSAFSSFNSHVYGNASFTRGGFAFGADYEMGYHRTYGIGGYARIYSKDDAKAAHGMTVVGVFARPHFHRGSWDFFFTGGFAIQSISAANNVFSSETAFGPSMGIGVLYHIKDELALGLEQMDHYGWFADDFKGQTMNDLAFKMRYSF